MSQTVRSFLILLSWKHNWSYCCRNRCMHGWSTLECWDRTNRTTDKRKRRWRCIGHTLRKPGGRNYHKGFGLDPSVKEVKTKANRHLEKSFVKRHTMKWTGLDHYWRDWPMIYRDGKPMFISHILTQDENGYDNDDFVFNSMYVGKNYLIYFCIRTCVAMSLRVPIEI